MIHTLPRSDTVANAETMQPHVLPKDHVEAYVEAFTSAAADNPQALLGHDRLMPKDITHARERYLLDVTIGCEDALGRIVCAGSVSYTGNVAELGNLFRTRHAPNGLGALVTAARLEYALQGSSHIVTDVCDSNRGVIQLFRTIGWEHWIQNDGYAWLYLGGKERVAEAIRILRTSGWRADGVCRNTAPSDMSKLSTRYYAEDHYYGF